MGELAYKADVFREEEGGSLINTIVSDSFLRAN